MTGLQADISSEFLKNFIPETVYLVEGDIAVSVPSHPEAAPVQVTEEIEFDATSPATVAAPSPVVAPEPATVKHAVHDLPKIPKQATEPQKQKYTIIGQNRKGVVVLVTIPDAEFQKLPQLGFLQKILSAIGLQPADVAYVNNVSGELALFEELQKELPVNYIISFASRIETAFPHEKFTLYTPVTVDSVPVVFSQALSMLETNVEHKKNLWAALQKTFNL